MSKATHRCDVAIVGGGMVGASLALALAGTRLKVTLIEAIDAGSAEQPSFDDRTSALGNGARRILDALGVWPQIVQGDRGYSSEPHRQRLRERGITPVLAKIGSPHGSGLGKTRWQVERSIAWLHSFRRLKIRYERYAHIHEAFLSLACALICWTRLKPWFN